MQTAIRVQNLGKCYRVGHQQQRGGYRTLRDAIVAAAKAPFCRWGSGTVAAKSEEDFWALEDVSFEVKPGEVVGIIGRNGAGKSTLLKILSRITKPTKGRIDLNGRVGSLLEVGTGFHPELSGRENIYLNGSILGMTRREIERKFDGIVDFAEIGKFIDTPVKRYSSGMYVRLAFAVAAHLEPEILIVDEVLAVGDIGFQRKCIGRMQEVGRNGTTVLFVSHNMPAIESLCSRGILLDGGRSVRDASVSEIVDDYRRNVFGEPKGVVLPLSEQREPDKAQRVLRSVVLLDGRGTPTNFVPLGGLFHLRMAFAVSQPIAFPTIGVGIDDTWGQRILTLHTPLATPAVERLEGKCLVDCRVENFPLAPGDYWIKVAVSAGDEIDSEDRVLPFCVVNGDAFGEGRGFARGLCVAPSQWNIHKD